MPTTTGLLERIKKLEDRERELLTFCAELNAEREKAGELLRYLEWCGSFYGSDQACPICKYWKSSGRHDVSCLFHSLGLSFYLPEPTCQSDPTSQLLPHQP